MPILDNVTQKDLELLGGYESTRKKNDFQKDLKKLISLENDYLSKESKAKDSDKLDGLNSTQFVRSDVNDTVEGDLVFDGTPSFNTIRANGNNGVLVELGESKDQKHGITKDTEEALSVVAERGLSVYTPDANHSNWKDGWSLKKLTLRPDWVAIQDNAVVLKGTIRSSFTKGLEITGSKWNSNNLKISGFEPAIHLLDNTTNSKSARMGVNGNRFYLLRDKEDNSGWDAYPLTINLNTDTAGDNTFTHYGKKVIHEGNLDNFVNTDYSEMWSNIVSKIPVVSPTGVLNIGKYLDFRDTNSNKDYDLRMGVWYSTADNGAIRFSNKKGDTVVNSFMATAYRTKTYLDLEFNNKMLISNFLSKDGVADPTISTNIDGVWHNKPTNTWHFQSDSPYKTPGIESSSVIEAGTFKGKQLSIHNTGSNNAGTLSRIGANDTDTYIHNGVAKKYLQLKNTGELRYDNKKVFHEGNSELPLGYNQTWQDMDTSRKANINYTNTTGRAIMVAVSAKDTSTSSIVVMQIYVGGQAILATRGDGDDYQILNASFIVPAGLTYKVKVDADSHDVIDDWNELR